MQGRQSANLIYGVPLTALMLVMPILLLATLYEALPTATMRQQHRSYLFKRPEPKATYAEQYLC